MEQQLSEATSNAAAAWAMGEDTDKLCNLQLAVREKDRVISRLECQVEEQVITHSVLQNPLQDINDEKTKETFLKRSLFQICNLVFFLKQNKEIVPLI